MNFRHQNTLRPTAPIRIHVIHQRDATSRYVDALKWKFAFENPKDPAVVGRFPARAEKAAQDKKAAS
jgi:hypothetical protein